MWPVFSWAPGAFLGPAWIGWIGGGVVGRSQPLLAASAPYRLPGTFPTFALFHGQPLVLGTFLRLPSCFLGALLADSRSPGPEQVTREQAGAAACGQVQRGSGFLLLSSDLEAPVVLGAELPASHLTSTAGVT